MTCADLLEDPFGFLERGFEFERLFRGTIFNFVHVISRVPQDLAMTELIGLGFDVVILLHTYNYR